MPTHRQYMEEDGEAIAWMLHIDHLVRQHEAEQQRRAMGG